VSKKLTVAFFWQASCDSGTGKGGVKMNTSNNKSSIRFYAVLTSMIAFALVSLNPLTGSVATAAVGPNVLTLAITAEPRYLDTSKATDELSLFVIGHTMEGLVRYDQKGKIVPGVAESWTMNDKGATFKLRKNAKWSDGKPVTAQDFVYGWTVAVDPKTASEYAFILYNVKNGEAINTKKNPNTKLGVEAIDDYTLKVTFENPCGHFLTLLPFATYSPMRKDLHEKLGDKFAADADKTVYNGEYILSKWVHGASLRMEKNSNYWDKERVQIATIDVPYITSDDTAIFNLFKDHKIDAVKKLDKDSLINAQKENFKLQKFADGYLRYMQFNFRPGRVTANKNLRKAIQSIFNPKEYVTTVVGIPGTQQGVGLVPVSMPGKSSPSFRKEYPLPPQKQDLAKAKQYLQLALKELNLTKIPPLIWLCADTQLDVQEAEYFQNLFKRYLSIDLKIDKQIFKQRIAKQMVGEFDLSGTAWGPDYNDPMTFVDLFSSWNENNNGKWVSDKYDAFVRKAQTSADMKVRMDNMAAAEKYLMEELPMVPLFERTVMYTHAAKLQGVVRRAVAFDPDYSYAKVVGSN
jgi:oligopeptide transport system substrate-binding protein